MTDTRKDGIELWLADQKDNGWKMPRAAWWKRLPVIRHFRCAWHSIRVDRHNRFWLAAGLIPGGYDRWVLWGMRHGFERPIDTKGGSEQ